MAIKYDYGHGSYRTFSVRCSWEAKTARIVEEVGLRVTGTDHVETVHDKVRRQQVEIERLDASGKPVAPPKV